MAVQYTAQQLEVLLSTILQESARLKEQNLRDQHGRVWFCSFRSIFSIFSFFSFYPYYCRSCRSHTHTHEHTHRPGCVACYDFQTGARAQRRSNADKCSENHRRTSKTTQSNKQHERTTTQTNKQTTNSQSNNNEQTHTTHRAYQ